MLLDLKFKVCFSLFSFTLRKAFELLPDDEFFEKASASVFEISYTDVTLIPFFFRWLTDVDLPLPFIFRIISHVDFVDVREFNLET